MSSLEYCQARLDERRVRSNRELDILSLQRQLEAVRFAREYRSLTITRLFKIFPERGDDWSGGLVLDLQRAARAVAGNGLLLDRHDRELLARRPWFGRELDNIDDGLEGCCPETRATYNDLAFGRLNGSRRGRVEAIVDRLVSVAERLLDAVAPRVEEPKRKRARKTSAEVAPHAGT